MKLITSKGQLAVPADFSFEMKKTNPFFSDEGEQSLPVTIPPSPDNIRTLGNPDRLGGSFANLRKTDARVECGIFHRSGKLIIKSIGSDGITASLALSESDLYAKSKDKSIREIFSGVYRDDFGRSNSPVRDWEHYLRDCANGREEDVFTCFPVFTDKYENDSAVAVTTLNEPEVDIMTIPMNASCEMIWRARTIQTSGGGEAVPEGYGITPFLYLHSFIDLLFSQLGYTVSSNIFSDAEFCNIVLLNRNADTICSGRICYGDIVPSCTVAEFLDFLEDKFHVTAMVDPGAGKVDIIAMEDILASSTGMDISGTVDGNVLINIGEESHVVLSSDTSSIDGAEPPAETIEEFQKKYPILTQMNETEFASALESATYCVIKRLATGEFYIRKYNKVTSSSVITAIGTDMFRYERQENDVKETHESKDVVPSMMFQELTSPESRSFVILAPYIGNRRHSRTSIKNKDAKKEDEQEIMIAFASPKVTRTASGTGVISINYCYRVGTVTKYNDQGVAWNNWGLNPEDIYTKFWNRYNRLLLNNNITIEMKADMDAVRLNRLKMSDVLLYNGTRILPKEVGYTLGSQIMAQKGVYMVLKDGNINPTPAPSFSAQLYKWSFCSNINEAAAAAAASAHGNLVDAWFSDDGIDSDVYEYMPPPADSGVTTSVFTRPATARVSVSGSGGGGLTNISITVNCWYRSVPI